MKTNSYTSLRDFSDCDWLIVGPTFPFRNVYAEKGKKYSTPFPKKL